MRFILKPSLLNIALVQVTTNLFNQHDVRELLGKYSRSISEFDLTLDLMFHPHEERKEWKKIKDIVIDKVPVLTIPTSLKEKIVSYIQPIAIEIKKWIDYHFKFCRFDLDLLNHLYWTPHGTIDKKKTAEVMIKEEAIDIIARYILACIYCLEDAIPELWYELPESHKISFYNEENIEHNFQKELLIFWGQYVRDKEGSRDNMIGRLNPITFSDSYMLQWAAGTGNKTATQYFLKKIIERKHSVEEVLLKTAIYVAKRRCEDERNYETILHYTVHAQEYCSEVFCFLLSQINNEQQLQLFKECPVQTLQCLLDWPWQFIFVETASHLFNFLPHNYDVLKIVIFKLAKGFKGYNYQKIFQDVWQLMLHAHKSHIINYHEYFNVLQLLLQFKDYENIKFLFKEITLPERKRFFFSNSGQSFCEDLILLDEWDLLQFCVLLFASSKDEIVKFKKKFKEHTQGKIMVTVFEKRLVERNIYKQAEKFFQHLVRGHDKRKRLDDGESNRAKKT